MICDEPLKKAIILIFEKFVISKHEVADYDLLISRLDEKDYAIIDEIGDQLVRQGGVIRQLRIHLLDR